MHYQRSLQGFVTGDPLSFQPSAGVATDPAAADREIQLLDELFDRLWPILRSITGPGIEQSFPIVGEHCRSARLTGPDGSVMCDLATSNLHVVNCAEPDGRLVAGPPPSDL
jgi:aminopeptidase-like protein